MQVVEGASEKREKDHFFSGVFPPVPLQCLEQLAVLAVATPQFFIVAVLPGHIDQQAQQRAQMLRLTVVFLPRAVAKSLVRCFGKLRCRRPLFSRPVQPGTAGGGHAAGHLGLGNGQQETRADVLVETERTYRTGDFPVEVQLRRRHLGPDEGGGADHPHLLDIPFPCPGDDLGQRVHPVEFFCEERSPLVAGQIFVSRWVVGQVLEMFAVLENPAGNRLRYAGDEFLPGERFPQQSVAQLDNGHIRLERFLEGVGVGEGVFVQQVEQGEQVVALHLDRRCREQHQTLADRPQQPAQFVGLGFLVAQIMGLVNDDHVEDRLVEGLFLEDGGELAGGPAGSPFRHRPLGRPQPLDAGDQGHFLHLATEQFFDGLIHRLGIAYLRLDAKTIEQFILPFFAEHGRTNNEQALGVYARAEFGPD